MSAIPPRPQRSRAGGRRPARRPPRRASRLSRIGFWAIGITAAVAIVAAVRWQAAGPAPQARDSASTAAGEPVERLPSEGHDHIPLGTTALYRTVPPTSGPHYDDVARPGLYRDRAPAAGYLVHNLEHGHVVIYYHPDRLGPEGMAYLEELTNRYRGTWDAVVAVPRQDPEYVLILTAWQHRQRLRSFDRAVVEAFVDRFRGRGPERPVR